MLSSLLFLGSLATAQLVPTIDYLPPSPEAGTVKSDNGSQWATVLGNSLYFFDAQRAGDLSMGAYPNRVTWRNNSVMDDGSDIGVDLSRGFFDAGNPIKCTFPLTFSLFAMAWGALSFGPGFDNSNQTPYLDSTLRWGFDWLMAAHPEDDVLVVQVGDPAIVNDYWTMDINVNSTRPSYYLNKTVIGTDAWASAAAALAMGALAYSGEKWNTSDSAFDPASLANETYSGELLQHARSLYDTAVSVKPYTVYSDSIPVMAEAYGSSYYTDDLITAAIALAAATGEAQYYKDAYNFYTEFALSSNQSMWGWESRLPAAYVLFAEVANARPGIAISAGLDPNVTGWIAEADFYFDTIVNNELTNGTITPGGLLSYEQLSNLNSLQPALAAAHLLFRYAPMASTKGKTEQYQTFAQSQVDYWLGKNPMNAPYMIGLHPNSPQKPHNSMASGADVGNTWDWDIILSVPEKYKHKLVGAVPGGPLIKPANQTDLYWDDMTDWQMAEPSLDYAANAPVLAAYELCIGAEDPYYVNLEASSIKLPDTQPCDFANECLLT